MPPFPERESSILAKLKKKKGPSTVTGLEEGKRERGADVNGGPEPAPASATVGSPLTPVPCTSPCVSRPRGWEPAERVPVVRSFCPTRKMCAQSLAVAPSLRPSPALHLGLPDTALIPTHRFRFWTLPHSRLGSQLSSQVLSLDLYGTRGLLPLSQAPRVGGLKAATLAALGGFPPESSQSPAPFVCDVVAGALTSADARQVPTSR